MKKQKNREAEMNKRCRDGRRDGQRPRDRRALRHRSGQPVLQSVRVLRAASLSAPATPSAAVTAAIATAATVTIHLAAATIATAATSVTTAMGARPPLHLELVDEHVAVGLRAA